MSGILGRIQAIQESLSDDALLPLKSYKYSSVDKSFISNYILRHYWNAFVELLPLWMAPNMVTLIGFMFIVGNVFLIEIFVPDLVGPGPAWIYFSFALGMWMYSTLDNVDGKQARRTGTSSGLGELFDHGIDSLNCTLGALLETAAMGLGSTSLGAYTAIVPCLAMYFSTWETYHTHTLWLGYINAPTEGLLVAIALMIVSGVCGPEVWARPITDFIDWEIFGTNSVKDLWVPFLVGSFIFGHMPGCILNVVNTRRKQGLPVAPVFKEWIPIGVFTCSNFAWLFSPYSTILSEDHLVLYSWMIAFVFGRMTTMIILAHLLKQPFPHWTVLQVPVVVGALLVNLPVLGFPALGASLELMYLWIVCIVVFIAYMFWAVLIINRITTFLGINCLTIRKDRSAN
ncbi:sn-1,2-diacylglycerol cholinephosphotransferase [Aspergillus taichungensis]|uniref:sn-1,2-diacylglycerol cholinephosphotransferase n=1 Tax=Aspergillus taichungensis TaxID=482145 RepID=A0A2J5HZT5_9EURO|nr:sn-1,2-diacylglycerol cholinephosphotransferase [Aspergillus taichungensis]